MPRLGIDSSLEQGMVAERDMSSYPRTRSTPPRDQYALDVHKVPRGRVI